MGLDIGWRFANTLRMAHGRQLFADWVARVGRHGVNKGQAAARIGISGSELSHLLSGRRRPTLALAATIQDETGIPATSWVPSRRGKSGNGKKGQLKSAALA